jgi:simple sugar transport system permease protein
MKRGILTALGLVVVLALTLLAFGVPVLPGLQLLAEGAFGDKFAISRTLVRATPLLLTALGMTVAWRTGVFNIGGEGQYIMGAIAGAAVARVFSAPASPVLTVLMLIAAAVGGGMYAALAGWLYVKRGVEIVISTILLNFIAIQILGWVVEGPLKERAGKVPQTDSIPDAAMLFKFDRQMDLHVGVIIALLMAGAVYLLMYRSRLGFLFRVTGDNRRAARANRIPADRLQIQAMAISGGLCGLAGGVQYLGVVGRLGTSFPQQWGFLGIPVALLGGLHPVGVVFASVYFGALFAGSDQLSRFTPAGASLVYVIQAAAVLGFVAIGTLRWGTKASANQESDSIEEGPSTSPA